MIPDNPGNVLAVRDSLTPPASGGGTKPIDPAIQNVSNKKSDTRKILEVTNLVTITAAVLTVLLTLASVLLIANTIRLSLYARRREVEVMKLVGATDWFIRWPFVIEGVFVGALGALLAIFVLGVTKVALLDPLANHWTLIAAPRTIAFSALVAVLLGSAVLVSAIGSGLSLRRFLGCSAGGRAGGTSANPSLGVVPARRPDPGSAERRPISPGSASKSDGHRCIVSAHIPAHVGNACSHTRALAGFRPEQATRGRDICSSPSAGEES